jgi:hypothetical protein
MTCFHLYIEYDSDIWNEGIKNNIHIYINFLNDDMYNIKLSLLFLLEFSLCAV